MRTGLLALLATGLSACSIGEGSGSVESDQLIIKDCWNGTFDLDPTFFGANPFRDTMMIRVQRGEQQIEVSDGVIMVVNDVAKIRQEQLGTPIPLGLPVGVSPPGQPKRLDLTPPQVSLSLYLFETCHRQNAELHSVDGWIQFDSLFSGDPNETKAEDRLTNASFEAILADPRDAVLADDAPTDSFNPPLSYPEGTTSVLTGHFRFYFQRGIPAQSFP